jgi:hypothetical protein
MSAERSDAVRANSAQKVSGKHVVLEGRFTNNRSGGKILGHHATRVMRPSTTSHWAESDAVRVSRYQDHMSH